MTEAEFEQELSEMLSSTNTRREHLRHDLFQFGLYYFQPFFTCLSADFHRVWYVDALEAQYLLLIAFRESAKTVLAMVALCHSIVYKTSRFSMYYCYDLPKAKARLFDVAVQLKTNRVLKKDFGSLWPSGKTLNVEEADMEKRSIGEFITRNRVKVKAASIGQSPRGELYATVEGAFRPELVFFDDVDTSVSVSSPNVIEKNYRWFKDEVLGGLDANARIIFLGNVIKKDGVVPRFENDYRNDPSWRIRRVAVEERGELTWPARFVRTDAEKEALGESGRTVVSLEAKRRLMGEHSFNANMLLLPYSGENSIIKRHHIRYGTTDDRTDVRIGADPSISQKTHSDPFGVVVTAHVGARKYVLEAVELTGAEKDPFKACEVIRSLYLKYQARIVNLETVAFQAVIASILQQKGVAVAQITPNRDKVSRLMEKTPDFENGNVFFAPGKATDALVEQLLSFPEVLHDDLTDALVYSFDGAAAGANYWYALD